MTYVQNENLKQSSERFRDVEFYQSGRHSDTLPQCTGVYRFYSENKSLLYIGKSINIRSRVNQHFNDASKSARQGRLMAQVRRIDCQLTAGEGSALLIENAAIKEETPLYNRRQRNIRRLWTIRLSLLNDGFLLPNTIDFSTSSANLEDTYGLFSSKSKAAKYLTERAIENGLCMRVLGIERGKGPCFQRQLGRCNGACVGKEEATKHNARLIEILKLNRIITWPFSSPILLADRNSQPIDNQPRHQYNLIDQWVWHGCYSSRTKARSALRAKKKMVFDRDAYRLIYRVLFHGKITIENVFTGETITNKFLRSGHEDE